MHIKKIKNKKGNLLTDEPIGLIIAVAAIVIIGILLWKLLFPIDANKEAQKAFFSSLKTAINEAKPNYPSEFQIWGNNKIYAVYFGDKHIIPFSDQNILFRANHNYERAFCICLNSEKKLADYGNGNYYDGKCTNYCVNLPGEIVSFDVNNLAASLDELIVKSGDKLIFNRDNDGKFYISKESK